MTNCLDYILVVGVCVCVCISMIMNSLFYMGGNVYVRISQLNNKQDADALIGILCTCVGILLIKDIDPTIIYIYIDRYI